MKRLLDRAKLFCREYVANGGDEVAAYKAAGYTVGNKKAGSIRQLAKRLTGNVEVQEYIEKLTKAANEASLVGAVDVGKVAAEMEFSETVAGQTMARNDAWFSALIMRRNEMLARLSQIARQEATEETIAKGAVVKRKAGILAAIKAMELIAKMTGELADKKQGSDDMVITVGMVGGEIEDAEIGSEDKQGDNQ